MSDHSLPLLFINLGGEMLYILDQRLTAQCISADKSQKVLNDIISTMLNTQFMEELFRPQPLYSKAALKTAFEKLAHASIMRLNATSMDKLYDLITMAVKFQVFMCPRPSDLLLITLNHIDALRAMASLPQVSVQVEYLYQLVIKEYTVMDEGAFQDIRYTLLNFFQDSHIRISMFLKNQSQNPNGRFVIPTAGPVPVGSEVPGVIRLHDSSGDIQRIEHFQNNGQYQPAPKQGSVEKNGDRGIKLGTNMYSSVSEDPSSVSSSKQEDSPEELPEIPTLAKEELNFLAQLLGNTEIAPEKAEFRLHLFDFTSSDPEELLQANNTNKDNILQLTPNIGNEELCKIMGEMESGTQVGEQQGGYNLLDLMDSTCN